MLTITKAELPQEDITVCFLECIVMPNGEIISNGKSLGWADKFGKYLYVHTPEKGESK